MDTNFVNISNIPHWFSLPFLVFTSPRYLLPQPILAYNLCYSNFNVHSYHLDILLKYKF